jgi:hypothetical protein
VATVDLTVGTRHCAAAGLANDPLPRHENTLDGLLAVLFALGLELGVGLDLDLDVGVTLHRDVDLAVIRGVGLSLGVLRLALALAFCPVPVGRWACRVVCTVEVIVTPEELPVQVRVSDGSRTADVLHQGNEVGGEQPRLLWILESVEDAAGQIQCIVARRVLLDV